jgi:hypothetical protein
MYTATKYLDALAEQGFLQKQKIGRTNYYVTVVLNRILIGAETGRGMFEPIRQWNLPTGLRYGVAALVARWWAQRPGE